MQPRNGWWAKGQIVREIDALGGYSGIISDKSAVQFRMLNMSKGPAMWSPSVPRTIEHALQKNGDWLERTTNVDFWQEMVSGLLVEGNKVVGVKTALGLEIKKSVVLTNGTFLNGIIHVGENNLVGEEQERRLPQESLNNLSNLVLKVVAWRQEHPLVWMDVPSITQNGRAKGDARPSKFSFTDTQPLDKQLSCWITYTNDDVHQTLKTGFWKSRQCFKVASKVWVHAIAHPLKTRSIAFAERERHQIFVEPEGWNTVEITSMDSLPHCLKMCSIRPWLKSWFWECTHVQTGLCYWVRLLPANPA